MGAMIGWPRPGGWRVIPSNPSDSSGKPQLRDKAWAAACRQEREVEGVSTAAEADPVLCGHCGRTASNGISCIGACVADSGY